MGPAVLLVNSDHLVRWLLRASPELPTGLSIGTWRTWLTRIHGECTGRPLPVSWRDDRRQYDWPTIEQALLQAEPLPRRIFLDEAQDIPVQIIRIARQHATSLMAFADPVQRFEGEGSNVEEVVDAIGGPHPWPVFALEEDFRTTRQIQAFATAAWAPSRVDPARPARRSGPMPRVVRGDTTRIVAETRGLLSNPSITSLVVATAQTERAAITAALESADVRVARPTDPESGRVRVLAFETLRGLEFDGVILVPPSTGIEWDVLRAHLYVAATRARHALSVVAPTTDPPGFAGALGRAAGLFAEVDA